MLHVSYFICEKINVQFTDHNLNGRIEETFFLFQNAKHNLKLEQFKIAIVAILCTTKMSKLVRTFNNAIFSQFSNLCFWSQIFFFLSKMSNNNFVVAQMNRTFNTPFRPIWMLVDNWIEFSEKFTANSSIQDD